MNVKKTALSVAIVGVMGSTALVLPTAVSATSLLSSGTWELTIAVTPLTTSYDYPSSCDAAGGSGFLCTTSTLMNVGNEKTGWNTSFTFGALPSNTTSQPGTNNGTDLNVTQDWSSFYPGNGPGVYGTADAAQTDFGRMVFDVNKDTEDISGGAGASFQIDTFFGSANGPFGQFINGGVSSSTFTGDIDGSGNMILNIANRFAVSGYPADRIIGPWNIEPGGSSYLSFTTGSLPDTAGTGTISGTACTVSGSGYDCVLVSYGTIGTAWGTLADNPYYEVWDVHLELLPTAAVPVPATVWLFGSGLLGLVGISRRKKVE